MGCSTVSLVCSAHCLLSRVFVYSVCLCLRLASSAVLSLGIPVHQREKEGESARCEQVGEKRAESLRHVVIISNKWKVTRSVFWHSLEIVFWEKQVSTRNWSYVYKTVQHQSRVNRSIIDSTQPIHPNSSEMSQDLSIGWVQSRWENKTQEVGTNFVRS